MLGSIRFGGGHSSVPMVPGGAGELAPFLTWMCWEKYVRDKPEFTPGDSLDELDHRSYQALLWHWIVSVWLLENPWPPREAFGNIDSLREALGKFDSTLLEPAFRDQVRRYGREFGRVGLNLEQCWAMSQLRRGEPCVLIVDRRYSANLAPNVSRMELNSEQLVWLLAELGFRREAERPNFPVLVSDGFHGHTISMGGLSGINYKHPRGISVGWDWFVFEDPWPARSLLAFEQNYGGAKAFEDVARPPAWVISPSDLNRVIVGFVLSYDEMAALGDMFQSMETVSKWGLRPLWETFGSMNHFHDGNEKSIVRLGMRGLRSYECARKRFSLPSAAI